MRPKNVLFLSLNGWWGEVNGWWGEVPECQSVGLQAFSMLMPRASTEVMTSIRLYGSYRYACNPTAATNCPSAKKLAVAQTTMSQSRHSSGSPRVMGRLEKESTHEKARQEI